MYFKFLPCFSVHLRVLLQKRPNWDCFAFFPWCLLISVKSSIFYQWVCVKIIYYYFCYQIHGICWPSIMSASHVDVVKYALEHIAIVVFLEGNILSQENKVLLVYENLHLVGTQKCLLIKLIKSFIITCSIGTLMASLLLLFLKQTKWNKK